MATTTQRGYGWEHQKARAQALDDLRRHPGQPCPYCQQPMHIGMELDYDHYPPLALGPAPGRRRRLACSTCNRRAGQAIAQQRRRAKRAQPVVNSRRW